MMKMMKMATILFVVLSVGVCQAQMPSPPPPIPVPASQVSEECQSLAFQISIKKAEIATLTAQKATIQASLHAAEVAAANAAANSANNPLWATYWNMQAAYYFAQASYWAGELSDVNWWLDRTFAAWHELEQAYTAAGC